MRILYISLSKPMRCLLIWSHFLAGDVLAILCCLALLGWASAARSREAVGEREEAGLGSSDRRVDRCYLGLFKLNPWPAT